MKKNPRYVVFYNRYQELYWEYMLFDDYKMAKDFYDNIIFEEKILFVKAQSAGIDE